jgi:hypothetical protein
LTSLPIEQRLLHYFLAMGAQQSQDQSNPETLSFLIGNERVLVSILTAADIIQRNRIIGTFLRVSSLRSAGTQLYVAAPRLLGATVDAQILRSSGIGLLLFDDRRIEETIKPQAVQTPTVMQPPITNPTPDPTMLSDLATLKSMYDEMERNMNRMMAEFKSLRENALTHTSNLQTPDLIRFEPIHRAETPFQSGAIREGTLPSFFTNNPWLDVLSKRGKTETAQFAG